MFDPRNIKLALVKDDPIGKAFQVQSFHRCQVASLIRDQLTPDDSNHPDKVVMTSTKSPGLDASISIPHNNDCPDKAMIPSTKAPDLDTYISKMSQLEKHLGWSAPSNSEDAASNLALVQPQPVRPEV